MRNWVPRQGCNIGVSILLYLISSSVNRLPNHITFRYRTRITNNVGSKLKLLFNLCLKWAVMGSRRKATTS